MLYILWLVQISDFTSPNIMFPREKVKGILVFCLRDKVPNQISTKTKNTNCEKYV